MAMQQPMTTYVSTSLWKSRLCWILPKTSLYKDVVLETYSNLTAIGYEWEYHNIEGHCLI